MRPLGVSAAYGSGVGERNGNLSEVTARWRRPAVAFRARVVNRSYGSSSGTKDRETACGHWTEDEAGCELAAPPAREAATMSTTQELQGLLDSAVQSVMIRGRGRLSSTEFSVESYAHALRDVQQRHSPDIRRALSRCKIEIGDQTVSDNLLSFLRAALQDYIHDDRIQTAASVACGLWGGGQELDLVAKKLLQLAVSLGTARTATLFTRSLSEPECRFQYFTLLGGVTVENPVEVYDGVRLAVLSKSDAELPGYIPDFSLGGGVNRFRGGTLIVEDMLASPRYMNPQDHEEAGGTKSFRVVPVSAAAEEFWPNEFCNALSLVAGARVFPSFSWKFISDDEPAKLSESMSGGISMDEPNPQYRSVVTSEQVQEAKHLYESLTAMTSSDRKRLTVPIDRLISSWDRRGRFGSQVDKLIDLGIALESLYLPDVSGELTYRLRTRGARYLGTGLAQRRELAGLLKAFYSARSKAVHSGEVRKLPKVAGQTVNTPDLISRVQDLCLLSIRKAIDGNFPAKDDWEAIELG